MELIVGALAVFGFVAVLARFISRDATGQVRLPRLVDESIGLWALRRLTGRPLGERPWDDEVRVDGSADFNTAAASRAVSRAIDEGNAADAALGPTQLTPTRYVVSRRQPQAYPVEPTNPAAPVVLPEARRRDQARRRGIVGWSQRLAAVGSVAVVLLVAVVALGFGLLQRAPGGQVLDATGRPQVTPRAQTSATDLVFGQGSSSTTPIESTASRSPERRSPAPTQLPIPSATPTPRATATARPTTGRPPNPSPVPIAPPTPSPIATPSPSPPPTPNPSPPPTPNPSPTETPTPTPSPTPTPTSSTTVGPEPTP